MRNHLFILFLFILFFISKNTSSQGYSWQRYTTDNGLSNNVSEEILQDKFGYLWIHNGTSISRFDGIKFTNFTDKSNYTVMRSMKSFLCNDDGKMHFTSSMAEGILNPSTGTFKYFVNDSVFSYLYVPDKEAYMLFESYIDKNGYRILGHGREKSDKKNNDTLYYQFEGKIKTVLLPENRKRERSFLRTDFYRNIWIYLFDTIKKEQLYYLFNKGQLEFKCSSKILQGSSIVDKHGYTWIVGEGIIHCFQNGKLVKEYSFPPIGDFNNSLPMLDSKNNVWLSIKEGLARFNLSRITILKDPNRHVPETIDYQYDPNGKLHENKIKNYNNFYNAIAIDKYDNIITGERIYDGHQFANVSFSKEFLNLFEGSKKENLPYLNQCFVDRESNIWYSSNLGLFKATPIPFKQTDLSLSFEELDYKLKASENSLNLYTKSDHQNKKIFIKILQNDSLKFNDELKLSKDNYLDISVKKFLNGFIYTYTDANNLGHLVFFNGKTKKEFISEVKGSYFRDLLIENGTAYYCDDKNFVLISERAIRKISNPSFISRIDYLATYHLKKVTLKNSTQLKFTNSDQIDTSVILNGKINPRQSFFSSNQTDPLKTLCIDKNKFLLIDNDKILTLKNQLADSIMNLFDPGRYEGFFFKNCFILSSYKLGYHFFNVDEKKREITYVRKLEYKDGLLDFYHNYFYYENGHVIIYHDELDQCKIITYDDFLKGNLNDRIRFNQFIWLFDQSTKKDEFGRNKIGNYISYIGERGVNLVSPTINFTLLSYAEGEYIHEFMPNVKNLEIPHNVRDINAEFQGICLTNGANLKYRTRLLGLDTEWEERGSEYTYVRYPTLSPGSYTFQVTACNNYGIWNDTPAEFSFTILPPWNRTWWAYCMYVVAGFAAIRGYLKNRTKKLEKEKEKLEKTVEERTAEVVNQKHLLEEKQKEIIDSITYAKRIQQSLMPTDKYISRVLGKKK